MLIILFAWLVGFGAAAAIFAMQRRRNPVWWAILGAILGPVALLILVSAPPGRCWSCSARTVGWSTVCSWCGEDVRGPMRAVSAPAARAQPEAGPERPTLGPLTVIQGTGPASRAPDELVKETAGDKATAAASATPAADGPVHRLKAVMGDPAATPAPGQPPVTTASDPDLESREIILASAIYVTGTRGLQAGSRYGIALVGTNLAILGPVDVDPAAIAVLRPLRGLDATGAQGQLIVTADEGFRGRFAMVFMALAGGTPDRVAEIIANAASGEALASQ